MDRFCPFCNVKMAQQHQISFIDYYCNDAKNHHFSERVKGNERKVFKLRVNSGKYRMYCKVDYDNGFTEIWEGAENPSRVRIEQVFDPNFSDMEALASKLRTYLLFS